MSIGRSIFLLFAMVCGVLVPIFVGHGLASHGATPFVIGAVLLVVSAASIGVLTRGGSESGTREEAGPPVA